MNMKKLYVAVAICSLIPTALHAADINFISGISQSAFKDLSREAGSAIAYRNLAPAAALGITGFDIGVEMSAISIDKNSSHWKSAFNNDAPSFLAIPKIRIRKGLPAGIDLGASYSYVPGSNIKLYGAELSKSILTGGVASPAVALRGTYTRLAGVSDLGISTYGIDVAASKGFFVLTPYAGVGMAWISSEAKGGLKTLSPTLASETIALPRVFCGVKFSPLPLIGITAEVEYAARPVLSLKAAASF